ncbi:PriCT-2 domain-containing protein [Paraburkholderia sediminicola]|uniref:PriCT-2 domain-containing protein n=1 Tax=Paraburkholderia sediminicola TaxID=458836 RepID=UPI0038B8117E
MTAHTERERAALALSAVPADVPRDTWWKIAAALKHEFGEDGFALFDAWSRTTERYDEAAARDTWRSLKASGGIRIGSLYEIAKSHGFDPKQHHVAAPTAAERTRHAKEQRERAERDARAQADEAQRRTQAADRAHELWENAAAASDDHPYLQGKMVRAHGLRLYRGNLRIGGMACDGALMVPLRGATGDLTSLEFIAADGEKRFLSGGSKAGSLCLIGDDYTRIVIAEGYPYAYPRLCVGFLRIRNYVLSCCAPVVPGRHVSYSNAAIRRDTGQYSEDRPAIM